MSQPFAHFCPVRFNKIKAISVSVSANDTARCYSFSRSIALSASDTYVYRAAKNGVNPPLRFSASYETCGSPGVRAGFVTLLMKWPDSSGTMTVTSSDPLEKPVTCEAFLIPALIYNPEKEKYSWSVSSGCNMYGVSGVSDFFGWGDLFSNHQFSVRGSAMCANDGEPQYWNGTATIGVTL